MTSNTSEPAASFNEAIRKAQSGDDQGARDIYTQVVARLREDRAGLDPSDHAQLMRSACFNLAQVLNRVGEFERAIAFVDEGLQQSPTARGKSIALAAKGEALCGLKRTNEGMAAFKDAAFAHPIVGRFNSADAMT